MVMEIRLILEGVDDPILVPNEWQYRAYDLIVQHLALNTPDNPKTLRWNGQRVVAFSNFNGEYRQL